MRKIKTLLTTLSVTMLVAGCTTKKATGPQTLTGKAKGLGGDVEVTLTVDNGKLVSVSAVGEKETEGIGTKALEQLPKAMVEQNKVDVDVITGATITSNAVIEAAKQALSSGGLKPEDLKGIDASTATTDVTKDVDVVIVGAGGAGMVAAITAKDAGKNVIVLESQQIAGGNSVRSTGGMNATGTKAQQENKFEEEAGVKKTLEAAKKYEDNAEIQTLAKTVEEQYAKFQADGSKGYFDSNELMELDTMIGGKGKNNFELVKTLTENTAGAVEWLETVGAKLPSVGQFGGASVKRIHRPVNADGKVIAVGAYIVPILEKTLSDKGIEVMYDTTAEHILVDKEGRVTGVTATTKQGGNVTVNAKAVVLTTGGFGANLDMVAEYNPALKGFVTTNAAGAQGQGIAMAMEAGAATVDMDQIQIHPTVNVIDGVSHLITEGLRGDGAILVNQEGKRFTDEVGTRDAVSKAEIEQTGSYAWLVIDSKMVEKSNVIQGYINSGLTVTGNTPEELAKAMGSDEATFATTLKTWNQAVAEKKDAEFNRSSFAEALDKAPYYAIKVSPGVHHTMGGVVINANAEVLTKEGNVISGLFAAGEVTGGVHGANRLGGNAVADFVVYGRIAGASAANYVK